MNIHRSRFVDYTPHTITHLAFSHPSSKGSTPSDLRLAVGRNNGDIEIWNPRFNWVHEQTLKGGKGRTIEGLAWALYDGKIPRLFSIGGSSVVTEWNLKTGMPLKNYDCNAGIIWSLKVNATNDKIAVGCDNGSTVLIDISGGQGSLEHDAILQRQNSRVLSVDFQKNMHVVGGCADGKIRVWNIDPSSKTRGRLVGSMKVDKSTKRESTLVWSVLVLEKQNQIISGDSTGSLKIWDLKYFTLQQSFDTHKADILSLTSDVCQEKIFSAGVDRKIFNFNLIPVGSTNTVAGNETNNAESSNKVQWVNSSSRLLHANDIRSIISFESKGLSLLVSGGVERQIVINSVKFFNSNIYRKLPLTVQYQNNIVENSRKRFLIMWQDQTVNIWKVFKNINPNNNTAPSDQKKNYRLISKLALSEEENISDVAISKKGDYLAVAYLSSIKVFRLSYDESREKLKVQKVKLLSSKLENVGARIVRFSNDGTSLFIVDPDNDLIKINTTEYSFNESGDSDDENDDSQQLQSVVFDLPELDSLKSKLGHAGNIRNFKISPDDRVIAVSRYYGALDLVFLNSDNKDGEYKAAELARLSSSISAIEFSARNTLVAITVENKIYEFNVSQNTEQNGEAGETDANESNISVHDIPLAGSNLLLTNWSKRNSDNLPKEFLNLKNKCVGMYADKKNDSIMWLWGADWICFVNLSINFTNNKKKNNKRRHDGLTIYQDYEFEEEDGNLTDNEVPYIETISNINGAVFQNSNGLDDDFSKFENNQLVVKANAKKYKTSNGEGDEDADAGNKENGAPRQVPFWITNKYKSLLHVGNFDSNDMIVVERPVSHLPTSSAFKTNHIAF